MLGQIRIDMMFAFIAVDKDGTEGLVATMQPGMGWTPLVGADMKRVDSFKPLAAQMAIEAGIEIKLVQFSVRKELPFEPLDYQGERSNDPHCRDD